MKKIFRSYIVVLCLFLSVHTPPAKIIVIMLYIMCERETEVSLPVYVYRIPSDNPHRAAVIIPDISSPYASQCITPNPIACAIRVFHFPMIGVNRFMRNTLKNDSSATGPGMFTSTLRRKAGVTPRVSARLPRWMVNGYLAASASDHSVILSTPIT